MEGDFADTVVNLLVWLVERDLYTYSLHTLYVIYTYKYDEEKCKGEKGRKKRVGKIEGRSAGFAYPSTVPPFNVNKI